MNRRWYFLGLAIVAASVPFHQSLLIVIGCLVLVVIGTTDIWYTFCLRHLRYTRHFSEERVLFGEAVTMSLALENAKILPLPWVEVEDTLPRALTLAQKKMRVSIIGDTASLDNLFSTRWYERVTRRYTVQCNARGVHKFGPTVLRSGDVFGFLSNDLRMENLQYLLVYPLVVPLSSFSLPSRHPFGDRRAPRRLLEDPSRVIGVRDYVYGDSLRRVHWKASARAMQMQSKVYEATTTYTMALFLNVGGQFDSVYGLQLEVLELAICATASVANWALDEGYAVGLYANTLMFIPEEQIQEESEQEGEEIPGLDTTMAGQMKRRRIHVPPSSSADQRRRIMDILARIQPYFGSTLDEVIQAERSHLPAGTTIVIVTSTISERLLDTLIRLRQAGHAVAILYAGESPNPVRLAGLTIYHIGGSETWQKLRDTYSVIDQDETKDSTAAVKPLEPAGLGFNL